MVFVALVAIAVACKRGKVKAIYNNPETKTVVSDTALYFIYENDIRLPSVKNRSDMQIDLLYNGVEGFLGGQWNNKVNFKTECLSCEGVVEFNGGLVFAKRLLITADTIKFYKEDLSIVKDSKYLKIKGYEGKRKNLHFNLSNARASLHYGGVSCNDANFYGVQLHFKNGDIAIDSLINAGIFEYDLDSDGQEEQYLIGVRNCSQELVILRIRPRIIKNRSSL